MPPGLAKDQTFSGFCFVHPSLMKCVWYLEGVFSIWDGVYFEYSKLVQNHNSRIAHQHFRGKICRHVSQYILYFAIEWVWGKRPPGKVTKIISRYKFVKITSSFEKYISFFDFSLFNRKKWGKAHCKSIIFIYLNEAPFIASNQSLCSYSLRIVNSEFWFWIIFVNWELPKTAGQLFLPFRLLWGL